MYRSPKRRGIIAICFLCGVALVEPAVLLLNMNESNQWSRISQGLHVSRDEYRTVANSLLVSSRISIIVFLASATAFLFWFNLAYRNLLAFRTEGLKYSSKKAVGFFFVPFISLFRPFQIACEIWKASSPAQPHMSWKQNRTPLLLKAWWASYIVTGVVSGVSMSNILSANNRILTLQKAGNLGASEASTLSFTK